MRVLWVTLVLTSLHWGIGLPLLAQSSQPTEWLSFGHYTLTKPLPDTLISTPSQPRLSKLSSSPSFTFHQKENTVLLYLRDPNNRVSLRVADGIGNTVQIIEQKGLAEGFYEFLLFNRPARSGLYTVRLVVNREILTFRIFP